MILPRAFFNRETVEVAKELLGTYFWHQTSRGLTVGKIVETEAYLSHDDPASHSFKGQTLRNHSMFGKPGTLYVYQIYGVHYCCNLVTGARGVGEAVLIRALEPIHGIELMRKRRNLSDLHQLCSGPAKLVVAMGLSKADDGRDTTGPELCVKDRVPFDVSSKSEEIVSTSRVGVTKAQDLPWRFYLKNNPFVSKK